MAIDFLNDGSNLNKFQPKKGKLDFQNVDANVLLDTNLNHQKLITNKTGISVSEMTLYSGNVEKTELSSKSSGSEIAEKTKADFDNRLNNAKNSISGWWDSVKKSFSDIGKTISENFALLGTELGESFDNLGNWFTGRTKKADYTQIKDGKTEYYVYDEEKNKYVLDRAVDEATGIIYYYGYNYLGEFGIYKSYNEKTTTEIYYDIATGEEKYSKRWFADGEKYEIHYLSSTYYPYHDRDKNPDDWRYTYWTYTKDGEQIKTYWTDYNDNIIRIDDGNFTYSYDSNGNLVTKTLNDGKSLKEDKYDENGNLIYTEKYNEIIYTYDPSGNLISVYKQGDIVYTSKENYEKYDDGIHYAGGPMAGKETVFLLKEFYTTYDSFGNITSILSVDFEGENSIYTYYDANKQKRKEEIYFNDNSNNQRRKTEEIIFDENGNKSEVIKYDEQGNVSETTKYDRNGTEII